MMDAETPKRPKGRRLKWAFGLSLALNLVFIGLFAGAALRFAGDSKGGRGHGAALLTYGTPFVRALPRTEQRKLRRMLRTGEGGLPTRAEHRQMHLELITAMRAEQFDVQSVERLFATQSAAAQNVMGRAQAGWLEIVRDMDALQRAGMADRLEEMLLRRKKGDKRKP